MTTRTIEILHLEDQSWDAELVERELRRAGLEVAIRRVGGREDLERALRERGWDVILLDHSVPGFGGHAALERARALAPGTPCLLVTGSLDEETAVEYMKAGAADYVLKDRLTRLGSAVEAALEHAARRRQLERQQALLQQVLDSAPALICAKDAAGRFVLANQATADAFGAARDELIGRNDLELGADAEEAEARRRYHRQVQATGRVLRTPEEPFTQPRTGVVRWFQVVRAPLSLPGEEEPLVLTVATDVTEARELATQLQLSQRLESVGRLAGGVAHDFNNFLMVVTGNAELLLRDVGPDDPARSALEQILAAGESAATLTRQLLAFGRRQDLRLGIADLDAIVSRAEPLLRRVVPANVDLVVRPGGGLGAIRADSGQLEQILMNLVVNARDAMPDGGQVTIETANQEVDEEQAHRRPPMPEGPYVMLAVTDAGTGMDEVTRSRAFEPFYTTKDQEQGTGLGLASVYGIVKQSGAFIWVESEPDRGTRFEILFPRISPPALEPAD